MRPRPREFSLIRRLFERSDLKILRRPAPTLGLAILVVCSTAFTGDTTLLSMPNPLSGLSLFVESDGPAARQAEAWRGERPGDARLLESIAGTPQAVWFGDWNRDVRKDVARLLDRARAQGGAPVLVVYNIPLRDCGSYSAGGAASAEAYRTWIAEIAAGLGEGPAVVVVEPDAVAAADCLDDARRRERMELVDHAVQTLKAVPDVRVYVDGGHPRWKGAEEMADLLRQAGVADADGFALNVSNTITTEENVAYGSSLSARLGGKHFVIDTSRNGVGSPPDDEWCNPSGRALGPTPTTRTGNELVDAYLWIKRPGESDGECNGGPSAGEWWAGYALDLARRAIDTNA